MSNRQEPFQSFNYKWITGALDNYDNSLEAPLSSLQLCAISVLIEKIATFVPMPSASAPMAASVNLGLRKNMRSE
jgi:hypothetical protein